MPDHATVPSRTVPLWVVLLLSTAGVCIAPVAWSRITANTIDPVARISSNGRQVIVTGPVVCDGGQQGEIHVAVTQRSTGAVAEGRTSFVCTGQTQQWEVRATPRGNKSFEEGPAVAVALGTTSSSGETDDAQQWLVNITLARK